jgi:type VI secretion system protein ImpA
VRATLESQLERLAGPVTAERPGGRNLDDSPELAAFDALRVFGLLTPPTEEPDWRGLHERALALLQESRDLRIVAHLVAAAAHIGTLNDVLSIFPLIDQWLTTHWDDIHPKVDEDAIARRNALNCFADRVAITDPLRRLPLLEHPQVGALSLRDIDIAMGVQPNPDPDREPRQESEITAALMGADAAKVLQLNETIAKAERALASIQDCARTHAGAAAVPDFDRLVAQLARIQKLITPRIPAAAASNREVEPALGSNAGAGSPAFVGVVQSRQQAVQALEAVAVYFRGAEPSSPIPLLLERAKRWAAMDFLQVLADIAPDALDQARRATGSQPPG